MDLPDDALVAVLPLVRCVLRLVLLLVSTDVVLLKVNVQLLDCAA